MGWRRFGAITMPTSQGDDVTTLCEAGAEVGPGQAFEVMDISLAKLNPRSLGNHWMYKA